MKLKWIIEDFDGDENSEKIKCAVLSRGHEAETIKYAIFQDLKSLSNHDNVICTGTITFLKEVFRNSPWIPGGFCTFANFDCSNYYSYYGKYLSNNDYLIMPLAELGRRIEDIKLTLESKFLFVRPTDGFKTFGGHVIYDSKDINYLISKHRKNLQIVVSSKKILDAEYRIFIYKNKILTGSKYKSDGVVHYQKIYEESEIANLYSQEAEMQKTVFSFVNTILKETDYRPDPIFAFDIGIHPIIGPRLLEISSFSCSGWYESDIDKLVDAGIESAKTEIESLKC